MKQSMIQLTHVSKSYENAGVKTPVLHDVNLEISEGEFVAIMGPSGSGKSTIMHILGFLDRASKGKYIFRGRDVTGLSDEELAYLRNQEIGFVFQAFYLLPRTTVLDNVLLPTLYMKEKNPNARRDALAILESVGLSHRVGHFSNQLSGGEKQRVAIARALVNHPSVIFADEPTGNLDSKSGKQIMEILQDLNGAGTTVILVTHEKYTSEHAKRIIMIRDGKILSDEKVERRILAKDREVLEK